jgi:hypothetical protein
MSPLDGQTWTTWQQGALKVRERSRAAVVSEGAGRLHLVRARRAVQPGGAAGGPRSPDPVKRATQRT